MYYRRKLLLGLLEGLKKPVPEIDLQRCLFLICIEQDKPAYEFIPHHDGCYSFQIDADKRTLTKYGLIKNKEKWALSSNAKYLHLLNTKDQESINRIIAQAKKSKGDDELIRHIYRLYPYYAINSKLKSSLLNAHQKKRVLEARPKAAQARLFTIGYEGKTLEKYMRELINQKVNLLCDVRKNPLSMKFGFNKNQLKSAVEAVGMNYMHIPELGIVSKKRKKLNTSKDYIKLFENYSHVTLKDQFDKLEHIVDLFKTHRRVALTCFESNHEQCHRGCVSNALTDLKSFKYRVVHI